MEEDEASVAAVAAAAAPAAPADPGVRQKIKKLAEYVVKNGVQFEELTRKKQGNDPGFDFLFGRDPVGFEYYEWTKRSLAMNRSSSNSTAEEPSPPGTSSSGRKERRSRGSSPDVNDVKESKKMRVASPPPAPPPPPPPLDQSFLPEIETRPVYSNGEAAATIKRKTSGDGRREENKVDESGRAEGERNLSKRNRSPDPRRRNRSRSRSPHRRNSRSPRRRSRSKSPAREHKRGDPRANPSRSRQICYDYSRGRCNKGSSCKYIHEEPEEQRGKWSKEREDLHYDSSNQKRSRDPRNPKDRSDSSRDPRDRSKEPRESRDPRNSKDLRNKEDNSRNGNQEYEELKHDEDLMHESSQVQAQQTDWTNLQSWHQGLNPGYLPNNGPSIAASLQALQEQNFQIPPPPPPFVPPGFGAAEARILATTPILNSGGLIMGAISPNIPGGRTAEAEEHLQQSNTKLLETSWPPLEDAAKSSPDNAQPAESDENQNGEADVDEVEAEPRSQKSKKDVKAAMLVRVAVTEFVKEVLKPTWKEGHMSKDVYKTIAKKAVDKVVGTLQSHQIPRNAEKVDHFMEFSRQKITKLVQGYVEKYNK